jgi:hypothetical protein
VHTVGADPHLLAAAVPATAATGNAATPQALRAVTVALASVGDEISRWPLLSGDHDLGLRGGQVRFTPRRVLRIGLRGVRWVTDATVTGTARWDQAAGWVTARLAVHPAHGTVIRMRARWRPFGAPGQLAVVSGTQGQRRLAATALAP